MRILAVDVGEKRIGIALSDALGWLATPLTVIAYKEPKDGLAAIEELIRTHGVEQVIVGYPRSLNGTVGPQAKRVDKFVSQLHARVQVPVLLWDERLSTAQAERHETGRSVQRDRIDALAAAVILQSYLDAKRMTTDEGHQ